MPITLSKTDKNLIKLLEENARQPISFYAKKLKISRSAVNFRLQSLINNKIITGFHTIIDLTAINYIYCRIFIRYKKVSDSSEKKFIEYLKSMGNVGWIVISEGKWDFTFGIIMNNIHEIFERILEISTKNKELIKEKHISILTQLHHFDHRYLYDSKENYSIRFATRKIKYNPDKLDKQILSELSYNSRITTLEISQKLNRSANTIKNRIKNLIQQKIILGFKPSLNVSQLGYEHYKVFLNLENIDKNRIKDLIIHISSCPNAIYVTQSIGRHNIEFEIELQNHSELNKYMKDLRRKFSDMIRDYSTLLHLSEPLINYLPKQLI